ncbi:MAG: hypothetical protein ACP5U2_00910 [Bryobacteraceae bacterium]
MPRSSASLMVNLFDGARRPLEGPPRVLIRVINGGGRILSARYHRGPSVYFSDVPCHGDYRDNYRLVVTAPGCMTTGIASLRLAPGRLTRADFMVLRREGAFHFHQATWERLSARRARWIQLLDRAPYEDLLERQPAALAGLLNLLAALEQTPLGPGTALDFFTEIAWDPAPAPDRFFAWARTELLAEVTRGVGSGMFTPELLPGVFHPGATASFKETRLPAANLQLTFHEGRHEPRGGTDCVMVETDIDYYPDLATHALLEVLPNTLLGRKTDPRVVYLLRWMASRQQGLAEFDPLYFIA